MITVIDAVKKIEESKVDIEVRVIRRIEVGRAIQQGDIYIHRVPDNHPRGKPIHSSGDEGVQIALGTGNGARHMACGNIEVFAGAALPAGCKIADVPDATIMGPAIVAKESWVLKHPEHAHHKLPAGTYQTTYQYDPKTMQRVRD